MASTRRIGIWGVVAVAIVVLPAAALAGSHRKPGLWKITTTSHISGVQMPKLTPQQMAQMKAMGVHLPIGNTNTVQHCVTPSEAKASAPPHFSRADSGCKTTNVRTVGHTMSADMVCKGKMKGQGHVKMTYESSKHYTGEMTFKGTRGGRPVEMRNRYEGTWISADCGNVRY